MVLFLFTVLFLAVFLLTKSYEYLERYYATAMYVSFVSIVYAMICSEYHLWEFSDWWVFTDHAFALLQAAIVFPCTTVVFLRYFPRTKWISELYTLFFVALYVAMEWVMRVRHEIHYSHGWRFAWSVLIDVLMFLMIWLHERNRWLTWVLSAAAIAFFATWFRVPLFV